MENIDRRNRVSAMSEENARLENDHIDCASEEELSPGVWPEPPRRDILKRVVVYILIMELAERLCYYTFSGSVNVYLRDYLGYSQVIPSPPQRFKLCHYVRAVVLMKYFVGHFRHSRLR